MDRSIKIVILLACVLSLGFGLIWDKVIAGARKVIIPEVAQSSTGPDRVTAKIGPSSIEKPMVQTAAVAADQATVPAPVTNRPDPNASDPAAATIDIDASVPAHIRKWTEEGRIKDGKYKVQSGDFLGKICHTHFKHLGKKNDDWRKVNPQFASDPDWKGLRPDMWITIPQ